MPILKTCLEVGGTFLILLSLIPLIRNDFWFFRVFEYPRLQKLFLNLVIIIVYTSLFYVSETFEIIFLTACIANSAYLFYQIYPFTFFAKKVIF